LRWFSIYSAAADGVSLAAELTSLPLEPQWAYRFTSGFSS